MSQDDLNNVRVGLHRTSKCQVQLGEEPGAYLVCPHGSGAAIELHGLNSVDHLLRMRNESQVAAVDVWFSDATMSAPVTISPGHTAVVGVDDGKPVAVTWDARASEPRSPGNAN